MVSSVIGSYSSTASGNGAGFAVLLGMRLKKIIAIEPMAPIVTTIFSMWSMINTTTANKCKVTDKFCMKCGKVLQKEEE